MERRAAKNLHRDAGEGDHEVVAGALTTRRRDAPSVSFAATSPARCRYGGGFS